MKFQLSKEFEKRLKKLDKSKKDKLFKKIDKILKNPLTGKPLKDILAGLRSERFNGFRIIYEVKGNLIIFHIFDHRKAVYKEATRYIIRIERR